MKKIDKRVARKLYNEGVTIHAIPHKLDPYNIYIKPFEWSNVGGRGFDELCNEAEHYNCNYETGYYLAFYMKRALTHLSSPLSR